MQPADTTRIAWGRHAKQRVASFCEPQVKDGAELVERPDRHDRRQPFPARQHANHFDPRGVTFAPTAVGRPHVHLLSHFSARVWDGALESLWIVVIEPFESMVSIQRFNPCAHPAAEITMTVGIDFDFTLTVHVLLRQLSSIFSIAAKSWPACRT